MPIKTLFKSKSKKEKKQRQNAVKMKINNLFLRMYQTGILNTQSFS